MIGPFSRPLARRATRMFAATGLAAAVGYAIAPNRWFWAFFAAFAVMAAANTAAEHVRAAIERAVGTACGVAVGVLAAHAFERQPVLSFGLLFVAMGISFYFQRGLGRALRLRPHRDARPDVPAAAPVLRRRPRHPPRRDRDRDVGGDPRVPAGVPGAPLPRGPHRDRPAPRRTRRRRPGIGRVVPG